jgi:diguanylate cyclase (GGDEF)-like protein
MFGAPAADSDMVDSSMSSWPTIVQCLIAGIVVGLVAVEAGAWRGELRRGGVRWGVAWTLSLATVSLLNGLAGAVATDVAEYLLLGRYIAFAAAVVLSLPSVQAYTSGPSVRLLSAVTAAWFVVGGALWLTTPLLFDGFTADGVPVYGVLLPVVELVPIVPIGMYVLRAVRGLEVTTTGTIVTVTAAISTGAVLAAAILPTSAVTEMVRGLWVVPLILGLEVLAASRVDAVRRAADRRARMRDALASVSNAAWLAKSPEELLETARGECRTLLADPSIHGTLRPLSKDRFVTEFYSGDGRHLLADEQSFLRDLARVVSSAAERTALTSKLRSAAYTDSLTGLHNRPALDRHLAAVLGKGEVEHTRVGVLFCDLENFKHANDMRGREWGDRLLVRVAAQLAEVAGPAAYVARHGGDHFVVVLERAGNDTELLGLGLRVHKRFEYLTHRVPATALTVGVSAWRPGEVKDVDALVRGADLAMQQAKRSGRGAAFYDERLRSEFVARTTMRRELEDGIAAGDIVVYFQPLTDSRTLEVVGMEALSRWRRKGVLVQPSEWLPLAEETGLIVEIGRQVFSAARAASEKYELPVAVNVAARQLDEADFVRHVEQSWGPGAWRRLTIEVTESALLHDAAHARASLATLAARGVRIALDDFGTGYNSLTRIGDLPVHVLKIDRTFVSESQDPAGHAVLQAVLAVARAHGLEVVAEGVECAEELETLVAMGVTTVQGFMLGRPAPTLPIRGRRPGADQHTGVADARVPHRLTSAASA